MKTENQIIKEIKRLRDNLPSHHHKLEDGCMRCTLQKNGIGWLRWVLKLK